MPTSEAFEREFSRLNPEQKAAVTSFDGPVLVIAGPGTGKTQVLTLRIAYILLHEDIRPQNILALTFTESGVHTMRERLVTLIGPTAYYVRITTFHGFCNDLILEYPDKFNVHSREFTSLSDLEKFKLVRSLIDTLGLVHLHSFNETYFYVGSILSRIQDIKKEGVTPDGFERLVADWSEEVENDPELRNKRTGEETEKLRKARKDLQKNQELARLYRAYQKYLSDKGRYDYEDMIVMVLERLASDPEFLLEVQERFVHFLVDEYQDTNGAQNRIVHLLASHFENPNLFAVGDDDQSIYRFQGANLANMLLMRETFANASSVVLKNNYRSTQTILDAAGSVIARNRERITNPEYGFAVDKRFTAIKPGGAKIATYGFSNGAIEDFFLVERIKELTAITAMPLGSPAPLSPLPSHRSPPIASSLQPPAFSDIAIIYRNNRDALQIMNVLDKARIPYVLQGGFDVLSDPFIARCIDILHVVESPFDAEREERLFTVLRQPWFGLSPLDLYKLYKLLSNHKATGKGLIDLVQDTKKLTAAGIENKDRIQGIIGGILSLHSSLGGQTVVDQVEGILRTLGVIAHLTDGGEFRRIHRLNSLYTFVKKQNFSNHNLHLADLLDDLSVMREEGIAIPEEKIDAIESGVHLMTAHRSKGLEFAHVFIVGCIDGKWGNKRSREVIKLPPSIIPDYRRGEDHETEDERRLFYVALTRAKESVTITHSSEYPLQDKKNGIVSQFVTEIDPAYVEAGDPKPYETRATEALTLALASKEADRDEAEREFLASLAKGYRLNAVAMNTYLKCPRLFQYRHLIRIPEKKGKSATYGTAIHQALEDFFVTFKKTGKVPDKDFLLNAFRSSIESLLAAEEERKESLERGLSVLGFYYDHYRSTFTIPFDTERDYNVRPILLPVDEGVPPSPQGGEGRTYPGLDPGVRGQKEEFIPLSGRIDKLDVLSSPYQGEVARPPQAAETEGSVPSQERLVRTKFGGILRVIDYKTGRARSANDVMGLTATSRGNRDYYNQLLFYKMLISLDRDLSGFTVHEGMLDFVSADSEGKGFQQTTVPLTDAELEDFKLVVKDVYARIQNLEFPKTDDRRHCADCPYARVCWKDTLF